MVLEEKSKVKSQKSKLLVTLLQLVTGNENILLFSQKENMNATPHSLIRDRQIMSNAFYFWFPFS
jgi:hypothetical protein